MAVPLRASARINGQISMVIMVIGMHIALETTIAGSGIGGIVSLREPGARKNIDPIAVPVISVLMAVVLAALQNL